MEGAVALRCRTARWARGCKQLGGVAVRTLICRLERQMCGKAPEHWCKPVVPRLIHAHLHAYRGALS
jgi:hypothetical protein